MCTINSQETRAGCRDEAADHGADALCRRGGTARGVSFHFLDIGRRYRPV